MNHQGTKTLETERLILRPFHVDDAEAMFRNWTSDPEVTKYLTWPPHQNAEISKVILTEWVKGYSEPNFYQWAIVAKENGTEPIGTISVVERNDALGMVEIGYCMGKNWWHQGIMTEALKRVIRFFFDEVGANRIAACHDTNNPNSGRVMQKAGMKYEGTLRQADRNNQGICDAACYALLASDWNQKNG